MREWSVVPADLMGPARHVAATHVAARHVAGRHGRLARVHRPRRALADGIAPGSPEGQAVLDRLVPAAERPGILAHLATFTDARVERYWQLLAVLNGQPPFPAAVPAFEWLIAALRARQQPAG